MDDRAGSHDGWPLDSRRLAAFGLAVLISSTGFAACLGSVDASYPYWILNDSDFQYAVEVREQAHETYVVPPHSYGPLFEARAIQPGWSITFVDQQCTPRVSFPVDAGHDLLYIDPMVRTELTSGSAWDTGLRTAKSVVLVARDPPCPDYAGTVVNDSDQEVILDERGALHQTWLAPPHSSGPLYDFLSPPGPGWTLNLVDAACNVLESWPVDSGSSLLYIGSTGVAQFTTGAAPPGNPSSAPASLVARNPACL